MEKQGGNREKLTYKINMKAYGNDQLVFQKCDVSNRDILTFKWHSHLLPCLLENIWQERVACPMSKIFKFGIFAKIVSLYKSDVTKPLRKLGKLAILKTQCPNCLTFLDQ